MAIKIEAFHLDNILKDKNHPKMLWFLTYSFNIKLYILSLIKQMDLL